MAPTTYKLQLGPNACCLQQLTPGSHAGPPLFAHHLDELEETGYTEMPRMSLVSCILGYEKNHLRQGYDREPQPAVP